MNGTVNLCAVLEAGGGGGGKFPAAFLRGGGGRGEGFWAGRTFQLQKFSSFVSCHTNNNFMM